MTASATWPAYELIEPRRYRERFGLAFDDFQPGQRFQHRPGLTLSQQDNRDECLDTLNQQMLHVDERFASHTSWGRCLMDSTLTTKVVMGMTWKTFARRTRLLGFDEIALNGPVFGGDTLYAESEIVSCAPLPDLEGTGLVKVRTLGVNQRGATVATFVYDLHVARGDAHGAAGTQSDARHRSHAEVAPGVFRERMGLFLDDIVPGETYEHRPGRGFSLAESARDTRRSLDHSWDFAAGHWPQPDPMAAAINPLHVLAVVTGMQTKTFSRIVANLAWQHVRFHRPVHDGDLVHAESTIIDVRPSRSRPGEGIVHLQAEAATAEGRTVCTFERKVLIYARGHGPYDAAGY
jgi:itaconyl-CoA hydratase